MDCTHWVAGQETIAAGKFDMTPEPDYENMYPAALPYC